jgi:hypothetical protein
MIKKIIVFLPRQFKCRMKNVECKININLIPKGLKARPMLA